MAVDVEVEVEAEAEVAIAILTTKLATKTRKQRTRVEMPAAVVSATDVDRKTTTLMNARSKESARSVARRDTWQECAGQERQQ